MDQIMDKQLAWMASQLPKKFYGLFNQEKKLNLPFYVLYSVWPFTVASCLSHSGIF